MTVSEQPNAPYLDAVVAYAFRGTARYHVPGHKGGHGADPGVRKAIGVDALAADIPQDIHGIDLGPAPTPYERAERLAAEAFGAARTWFLTNGATQGNHALCLALALLGTRVVAQRNSHASIVDGLVLSGGLPSFVAPEYDEELGITHAVTPAGLEAALRGAPDAKAAFIVSPTYYGMAADVRGLAEVAHAAGVPLIVDPVTTLRNEVAVPPREAFLGDAEVVAVDAAVGRISCESIASYPPGVPALLPGERISAETVAYLRELAASGARLHGASDPAFKTINVLRER
jgi:arginine/lysine/ornithine decarboxylase